MLCCWGSLALGDTYPTVASYVEEVKKNFDCPNLGLWFFNLFWKRCVSIYWGAQLEEEVLEHYPEEFQDLEYAARAWDLLAQKLQGPLSACIPFASHISRTNTIKKHFCWQYVPTPRSHCKWTWSRGLRIPQTSLVLYIRFKLQPHFCSFKSRRSSRNGSPT